MCVERKKKSKKSLCVSAHDRVHVCAVESVAAVRSLSVRVYTHFFSPHSFVSLLFPLSLRWNGLEPTASAALSLRLQQSQLYASQIVCRSVQRESAIWLKQATVVCVADARCQMECFDFAHPYNSLDYEFQHLSIYTVCKRLISSGVE